MATKMYWTLEVRYGDAGKWCIEFGDWDRSVVKAEMNDYKDHGHKAKNLRIVGTLSETE